MFTSRHTSCPNSGNLHSSSAAKATTPTYQGPGPTEAGPSWLIIHTSGAIQGLQPTVQQPPQLGTQTGTGLSLRFQAEVYPQPAMPWVPPTPGDLSLQRKSRPLHTFVSEEKVTSATPEADPQGSKSQHWLLIHECRSCVPVIKGQTSFLVLPCPWGLSPGLPKVVLKRERVSGCRMWGPMKAWKQLVREQSPQL